VETYAGETVYVSELCAELGIASRTLRYCCSKYLGVGPKRYRHLQRMYFARAALLDAGADQTSVTKVATQFGFLELGRFAVEYKAMFGESPSATLRRLAV
jgi:transcriptional regulator GlxA family with amidase domain